MSNHQTPRIKITKDGPYQVSGSVPIFELIITPKGEGYVYEQGRIYPQRERYALCRCGHSANMPFCDASHSKWYFNGTQKALRVPYLERAAKLEGPGLALTDDYDLCAFARFCHSEKGSVWELLRNSDQPQQREMAIKTASECPAGRLVAWDLESGQPFEPQYEPSIVILQDPQRECSGPLWVRGGIVIEGEDGYEYEVRNRVTLCRCGKSSNMPFCDATHVRFGFQDDFFERNNGKVKKE